MSELGDLLVLLHDAGLRTRTVRATGRTWHHADRARAAADRAGGDEAAPGDREPPAADQETPGERVTAWRLLFERPDRARVERDRPGGEFRPPLASLLLDPSVLLGAFRFTVTGRAKIAGRPAIAATAVRTGRVPTPQTGLPPGADELELMVDAEFGVLLRLVCTTQGEAFDVQQIREIAFDAPIPEGAFDRAPEAPTEPRRPVPEPAPELVPEPVLQPAAAEPAPPVAPARAAEPVGPVEPVEPETAEGEPSPLQPVSLEEAVRRAGFPVLLPRKVPDGPRLRILLSASKTHPNVQLHYEFEAPTHHLRLDERPAATAAPATVPFERRTHRGQELEVWDGPEGERAARIERGGIAVRLDTDLDLEALMDVAVSLVPVRVTRSPRGGRPPATARNG